MAVNVERIRDYFDTVQTQLNNVLATQSDKLYEISALWSDAIASDHLIYVFGSGHSRFVAGELHGRAGGLAPILAIEEPTEGAAEQLEGYAHTFIEKYNIQSGDLLVVVSNSGINAVPLEVALLGRELGATVIALTSLNHSTQMESRHSSNKRLFEVADHVIDTMGNYGDAAIPISGREWKVAPTSTAISIVILNAVVAQTAELLNQRGIEPPIFISANVPEGNAQNEQLIKRYWARLARFPMRRTF